MGTNIRLSTALHGVAFDLDVDGSTVLAVASAGYLERQYGAQEEPTSWLRTYLSRQADIDGDARAVARERGRRIVVLIEDEAQEDTMPAALLRH